MHVCIHRGARQIGGSCVEVESGGRRIVIDIGLPLDADRADTPLPAVAGLQTDDDALPAVAISHAHVDHYGLAAGIRQNIPVLIGKGKSMGGRKISGRLQPLTGMAGLLGAGIQYLKTKGFTP